MMKRFLVKLVITVSRIILFLFKFTLKLLAICLQIFFAPDKEDKGPSFSSSIEKQKDANRTLADTAPKNERDYYLQ